MKLQATYWKDAKGSIKTTIKVLDAGDYPQSNIFPRTLDDGCRLGEGTEDTISQTLPSAYDAKQWVWEQINSLKGKLNYWRDIVVPERSLILLYFMYIMKNFSGKKKAEP